ncbi:ABC transporter permease [Acrocarpospora phusangensis]|uniref:ABC transporter permease n=1 Tax=Acrocarpospora phusangensis TaxID=1070424 RepID=A0A919UK13_9ACTN|nr:ABC transporter permease [Acrocarpospora phusangensis]GIH24589.1 ABC transporter permease [Acrocarpospora phusangensis]
MPKLIVLRLLRLATLLAGVSALAFTLVHNSPIDPIQAYVGADVNLTDAQYAALREHWGLDRPPVEQYLAWAGSIIQGDLGVSTLYKIPVADVIATRFGASLALMGVAWLLSGLLGYALGVLAAIRRGRFADRAVSWYSYTLSSTPTFWLGIVFLVVFSVWLGWFPVGLAGPYGVPAAEVTFAERVHHFVLPALTLSAVGVANIAMHTREKMTDVLNSDYVAFARARGESPGQILRNHGFRNSAAPAVTLQFAYFSELFGGSVLAETVFSYPGLGSTLTEAALGGDVPLLLGIVLLSAVFVFTGNVIADIVNAALDPRVRRRA